MAPPTFVDTPQSWRLQNGAGTGRRFSTIAPGQLQGLKSTGNVPIWPRPIRAKGWEPELGHRRPRVPTPIVPKLIPELFRRVLKPGEAGPLVAR